MANVLIACEYSGAVRRAFAALGHTVTSIDLLPSDDGVGEAWDHTYLDVSGTGCQRHLVGDVLEHLAQLPGHYDMLIGFPPCTHLSASGARWWPAKRADGRQQEAVDFFMALANADVPLISLENPIGYMSTAYRKPDCIVQPWEHGHGEQKSTCLWLKGLPVLEPTNIVEGRKQKCWLMPETADRWKKRSTTYSGIAAAMAAQWAPMLP